MEHREEQKGQTGHAERHDRVTSSGVRRIEHETRQQRGPGAAPGGVDVLEAVLALGFLCFLIYEFVKAGRSRVSAVSMIQLWTTVLFAAVCIASAQFYAWYLVILVPLAVLTAETFLGRATLVLTVSHVLAFADLRRKSIGYFAICTLLPMAWLYWQNRREAAERKNGAALRSRPVFCFRYS